MAEATRARELQALLTSGISHDEITELGEMVVRLAETVDSYQVAADESVTTVVANILKDHETTTGGRGCTCGMFVAERGHNQHIAETIAKAISVMQANTLRDEAIRQIATNMDVPPEVVLFPEITAPRGGVSFTASAGWCAPPENLYEWPAVTPREPGPKEFEEKVAHVYGVITNRIPVVDQVRKSIDVLSLSREIVAAVIDDWEDED